MTNLTKNSNLHPVFQEIVDNLRYSTSLIGVGINPDQAVSIAFPDERTSEQEDEAINILHKDCMQAAMDGVNTALARIDKEEAELKASFNDKLEILNIRRSVISYVKVKEY